MKKNEKDPTCARLLEKSKEAFALAVELYNRPTLKYHAEACSIFLCNAWELMLKAYLIDERGIDSIYYSDNPDRTIALEDCLKKIYTNEKSPLRVNMRELIRFRNTNTHFITDEYELFYGPFLQASVTNYADQLEDLHGDSVSEIMPENHLALAIRRGSIEPDVIRAKYDVATAQELLKRKGHLSNAAGPEGNQQVAAVFETSLRLVKKEGDADLNVFVARDADAGVAIVKDVKDAMSYYPYTPGVIVEKVNKRLRREGIKISRGGEVRLRFNMYDFTLFTAGHHMKGDARFSYDRSAEHEKNASYVYNPHTVDFIVGRLSEDPGGYLDKLKNEAPKK